MTLCKIFMRHNKCKQEDNCKYYHPKKLRNQRQTQNLASNQTNKEANVTYAQVVKKPFQPQSQSSKQSSFIGQNQFFQQPVTGFQQPMMDQGNQNLILEVQNGQTHMMQLIMNLSQKIMTLEKFKPLM